MPLHLLPACAFSCAPPLCVSSSRSVYSTVIPHPPTQPTIHQGNPNFLEAVASWQKKLGTVDLVLNVWNSVQRKWQALESIFVGSADIRVQLPEDSKRFDAANADYVVGGWGGVEGAGGLWVGGGGWAGRVLWGRSCGGAHRVSCRLPA